MSGSIHRRNGYSPLILNKRFGLCVSVMLYIFDFKILLVRVLFLNKEAILYGVLLLIPYTIVLNKMLVIGCIQTPMTVISNWPLTQLNRSITDIDLNAFMIVTRVNGGKKRFTLLKKRLHLSEKNGYSDASELIEFIILWKYPVYCQNLYIYGKRRIC